MSALITSADCIMQICSALFVVCSRTTKAVICSFVGEYDQQTKKVKDAKKAGVLVVSEELLSELESVKSGDVAVLLTKHKLSEWGNVEAAAARVRSLQELQLASAAAAAAKSGALKSGGGAAGKSTGGSKSTGGKSRGSDAYTKSVPEKLKLKLKGGVAVEPDSGLADAAHVLKESDTVWNAVLGLVDLVRGTNAFYKLQLLQSDDSASRCFQSYWLLSGCMIFGYTEYIITVVITLYTRTTIKYLFLI